MWELHFSHNNFCQLTWSGYRGVLSRWQWDKLLRRLVFGICYSPSYLLGKSPICREPITIRTSEKP